MKKYAIYKNGDLFLIIAAKSYIELCTYIRMHNAGRIPSNIRIYDYTGTADADIITK